MGIKCASYYVVAAAQQFDHIVYSKIAEKKEELDKISFHLRQDAILLRNLRRKTDGSKEVDLSPFSDAIASYRKQHEEIQNSLDSELKSSFDFDKLDLKKVPLKDLEALIDEVEGSKSTLENRVQPDIMVIETQIQLMKLLSEITKYVVQKESELKEKMMNRAGR
ncbi:hypothetical protein EB008_05395 [bacterium]|jgi:hypothetical protein|nr:hypothetical protein [bacterium]